MAVSRQDGQSADAASVSLGPRGNTRQPSLLGKQFHAVAASLQRKQPKVFNAKKCFCLKTACLCVGFVLLWFLLHFFALLLIPIRNGCGETVPLLFRSFRTGNVLSLKQQGPREAESGDHRSLLSDERVHGFSRDREKQRAGQGHGDALQTK